MYWKTRKIVRIGWLTSGSTSIEFERAGTQELKNSRTQGAKESRVRSSEGAGIRREEPRKRKLQLLPSVLMRRQNEEAKAEAFAYALQLLGFLNS
jgi:hypothetical protein